MTLKKDFKNVLTTIGVIAVILSIGGVTYASKQEGMFVDSFENENESEVIVMDTPILKPLDEESLPKILIETVSENTQKSQTQESTQVPVQVPTPTKAPVSKPVPVTAPPVVVTPKVIPAIQTTPVTPTPTITPPTTTATTVVQAKTTTVKKTRTSRAS